LARIEKMDWTVVNWFPSEQTMDITPENLKYNKPRFYISYTTWIPIAFGILNHLLNVW